MALLPRVAGRGRWRGEAWNDPMLRPLRAAYRLLTASISPEEQLDLFRRALMMNLMIVVGSLALLVMGVLAFAQGNWFLGTADYVALAACLAVGAWSRDPRHIPVGSAVILVLIAGFFLLLFCSGGVQGTAFLWVYVYPLISVFTQGARRGAVLSFALLAAMALAWVGRGLVGWHSPYSANLMLRLVPSYLTVLLLVVVLERVRAYTAELMQRSRDQLAATVAELEQAKAQLRELAIHDGLTGLHNRRFFDEVLDTLLKQARRHESRLAMLMVDVDHFKAFNDQLGHLMGDTALREVARALERSLRRESDMAFRYGGEEFAVVLTRTSAEATEAIARRIVDSVRALGIAHPGSPRRVLTVSVGLACWDPEQGGAAAALVERADKALYRAKEGGRDQVAQ